jgi:hypothetical protein
VPKHQQSKKRENGRKQSRINGGQRIKGLLYLVLNGT